MGNNYRMAFMFVPKPQEMNLDVMRSHWALIHFDIRGDSIVAFIGTLHIDSDQQLDILEAKGKLSLPDCEMLNLVVEHFGDDLEKGILRQNILLNIAFEKILHRIKDVQIMRWGEDLYEGNKRLTVSSVSTTFVSVKIHLGICINPELDNGFVGLTKYSIDPVELAEVICNQYRADMRRLKEKCWHIKPVI